MSDETENTEADGEDEMAAAMEEIAAEEAAEGAADGSAADSNVELEELSDAAAAPDDDGLGEEQVAHTAAELEPVYDVPVNVQAVLGKSYLEVSQLLKLGPGAIVELDRKVGEAIDIYVNDRLVARGEVVLVEDHLGVTMTEIIKSKNA
jgi:flagellar motor switch protein FliN/FliY